MRYARHLALPEVGAEGQARLGAARVLVVGAGGLGSPAALYLAAAGVGTLGIVDADRVELSNLQRQILHDTPGVGEEKVASAARRLHALNPEVRLEPHPVRLEPSNALELIRGYDLVVDGSDNLATRYLVNDACLTLGLPWVYGAVERWVGHVAIFAAPGGPCFRCLFRDPPPPGAVPGCAEAGVVGALPGIIGSMQALEAIKWIVQTPNLTPLVGRLLVFDGARMTARHLHPARQAACPACGPEAARPFLHGDALWHEVCSDVAGVGDASVEGVSPVALQDRLARDPSPILLDVRALWEWEAGNLSHLGARFLGPWPVGVVSGAGEGGGQMPPLLAEIPQDAPVVLYCRGGGRSLVAARAMVKLGFRRVAHLEGGLIGWARDVSPDQVVA